MISRCFERAGNRVVRGMTAMQAHARDSRGDPQGVWR